MHLYTLMLAVTSHCFLFDFLIVINCVRHLGEACSYVVSFFLVNIESKIIC